jgi:hypothetical protein
MCVYASVTSSILTNVSHYHVTCSDPMRITKKFAGASCIGKQVFQLNYEGYFDAATQNENEEELRRLENIFLIRINGRKRNGEPNVLGKSAYETTAAELIKREEVSRNAAEELRFSAAFLNDGKKPVKKNMFASGESLNPQQNNFAAHPSFFMSNGDGSREYRNIVGQNSWPADDYACAYDTDENVNEDHSCDTHGASSSLGMSVSPNVQSTGSMYNIKPGSYISLPGVGGGIAATSVSPHGTAFLSRRVASAPNLSELGVEQYWKDSLMQQRPGVAVNSCLQSEGSNNAGNLHQQQSWGTPGSADQNVNVSSQNQDAQHQDTFYKPMRIHFATSVGLDDARASFRPPLPYSSLQAKKRSHSAMALMDLEKVARDDSAAGNAMTLICVCSLR